MTFSEKKVLCGDGGKSVLTSKTNKIKSPRKMILKKSVYLESLTFKCYIIYPEKLNMPSTKSFLGYNKPLFVDKIQFTVFIPYTTCDTGCVKFVRMYVTSRKA